LRELARQEECEGEEGHLLPDHVQKQREEDKRLDRLPMFHE